MQGPYLIIPCITFTVNDSTQTVRQGQQDVEGAVIANYQRNHITLNESYAILCKNDVSRLINSCT